MTLTSRLDASLGGLITPFLPLSTIKELYVFFKNRRTLKNNEEILFTFSLMYLQKMLTENVKQVESNSPCPICKITSVEIDKISDTDVDDMVFRYTSDMCSKHMLGYLETRKFGRLMGKALLKSLKKYD